MYIIRLPTWQTFILDRYLLRSISILPSFGKKKDKLICSIKTILKHHNYENWICVSTFWEQDPSHMAFKSLFGFGTFILILYFALEQK